MNFLNPAVLIGMLAASIPLILHLINLRKLKTIEFSSLKFIKELQKTRIKRLKIKQWLLLLIRTLIIASLVMAFARPVIDSKLPYFQSYSKTSSVILIDNTFSMDVSDEFGNRLKQAKESARTILSSFKDGDEIAIIPIADNQPENNKLFRNLNYIEERIDNIQISQQTVNLRSGITSAYNLLEDAVNLNKEIFIISDGANNLFNRLKDTLDINAKDIGINFIQTGGNSKADIKNFAIDSLKINNNIFQFGRNIQIDALISNSSSTPVKELVVSLIFNDKRIAQRSVDLPANNKVRINIETKINQRGPINARLELESDELIQDNDEFFSFIIPDIPKIAILSDKFTNNFLKLAIRAADTENIEIDEYNNGNIGTVNLNNYDLILLSKGPYNNSDLSRIKEYVNGGGSLLAFAYDKMNNDYMSFLDEIGFGTIKEMNYGKSNPSQFDYTDLAHPLFEGIFIQNESNKKTDSPEIFKTESNSSGQILIKTADANILSESSFGNGKILYYGISPDMSMSDFPVNSLFPVLMYKSIMYLTANQIKGNSYYTGDIVNIKINQKYSGNGNFKIQDPNGNEFFYQAANLPSGSVLNLDNINIPGNYYISNNDKIVSIFSINNDPNESDLKLSNKNEIEDYFSYLIPDSKINFISDIENISDLLIRARIGTELWQIFIIFTILLAVAEMILQKTTKNELSE